MTTLESVITGFVPMGSFTYRPNFKTRTDAPEKTCGFSLSIFTPTGICRFAPGAISDSRHADPDMK